MKPVKTGIIGCGVIAQHHLRSAREAPGLEVVAVADRDPETLRRTAEEFEIKKRYEDAGPLIDDPDVDAVVLALPAGIRCAIAVQALKAGKHVLLEKPTACSVAEVDQLLKARGELTVGVCSSRFTFLDSARVARETVASGVLGPLRVVRARGLLAAKGPSGKPPPPWRLSHKLNGGGIMANWGCYDLNYLLEVTGWQLRPRTVLAQAWQTPAHLAPGRAAEGSDAENHVAALIRCDDGIVLSLERGEFLSLQSDTAWQITGERGSLRLQMVPGQSEAAPVINDVAPADYGVVSKTLVEGPVEDVNHLMPIRDFAEAVSEGRPPRTSLEKGRLIQQLTDAIYESARTGDAVKIDPTPIP